MASKRRDNGDGGLVKRTVGGKVVGWVGTFDIGTHTGRDGKVRRHKKAVYGKDKAETKAKLAEARKKYESGRSVVGTKLTTEAWLERWLSEIEPPKTKLRARTFRGYRDTVRKYLAPQVGQIPLEKLSIADVESMMGKLLATGLSGRTVYKVRAVLWTSLKKAMRHELIMRNVVALTEPPLVEEAEFEVFTPEQATVFQEAIKGDPNETLYLVALVSGFRQGELLGLRWSDVELEAGVIHANMELERIEPRLRHKKDERFALSPLKTKFSKRPCVLEPVAAAALREHRASQAKERLLLGGRWLNQWDLVFTTEYGAPIDGTGLTRRFQGICKAARLPRLRFHDLRHTAAVLLLENGQTVHEVAAVLGHGTPDQVIKRYGKHIRSTAPQAAASAMARALGRVTA